MKGPVAWRSEGVDARARAGVLTTRHGEVPTPAFMPVGTRGSVKTIDGSDLEVLGADIVLANTYHLAERPGADVVRYMGGLHGFMSWERPVLTDSGGFQVLSLRPDVTDEGVVFRSSYDGSRVELTPESAISTQESLGSDIAMVLDELIGLPASPDRLEAAVERTTAWAARSSAARTRPDQGVFGIVQGGDVAELRARSASEIARIGFDGYGIGGLSVGESLQERAPALDAALGELPEHSVRYVMGLGDTEGLLDAIARGVDMFDCVLPTRLARHGKALHPAGDLSMKRREWLTDDRPIDDDCVCPVCRRYSRSYIRHLVTVKEPTAARLLTVHNLSYTLSLLRSARMAILDGRFDAFRRERESRRSRPGTGPSFSTS